MRFTALVFAAGLVASVAAIPQESASRTSTQASTTSTTVSVQTPTQTSSYPPEVQQCLDLCPEENTACRASCLSAPAPTEEDMNDTTACAAKCDQGDGSEAATEKFGQCVQSCIKQHFLPEEGDKPTSQASGTGSATGSAPTASGTGSGRSNGNGSNSTATGTGSDSEETGTGEGAASGLTVSACSAAIVAAIAAAVAL